MFLPFHSSPELIAIGLLLLLWSLLWKAAALWVAARRGQKAWFIILMIVNTLGILEIIYLTFVADAFATKTGGHHGYGRNNGRNEGDAQNPGRYFKK
jgi:Family of unknown function (DUF5652)